MSMKMNQLTLALIDEGQLLEHADDSFRALQDVLTAHIAKYGEDANKSKAKFSLEVSLCCEDAKTGTVSIVGKLKTVEPVAPASVTLAFSGEDDDGAAGLFVRESGSSHDTPRQGVFSKTNGEQIKVPFGEDDTEPIDADYEVDDADDQLEATGPG